MLKRLPLFHSKTSLEDNSRWKNGWTCLKKSVYRVKCHQESRRYIFLRDIDGSRILHTLLVKHYNDSLDRQSSEQGKDEVTYFYVGDVFCIHLGTKYADFQEKIFAEISGKKFQTLGIT